MGRFFEYIGLVVLFLFSYYYTGRIGEMMSNKNTIMVNLEEKNSTLNSECTEGYINENGVVLGINGLSIDIEKSYQNMKGLGYDETLIEYNETVCVVNKENSLNKYIIKGNPSKSGASIMIDVKSFDYVDYFVNIAKDKNILINFIVDNNTINKHKDKLLDMEKEKFTILFKGNNIKDYKNTFNNRYCVYNDLNNMLEICGNEKINTLKTNKYYNKEALSGIKNNLEKGDLIILEENKKNLEELSSIINYINSKGLDIISISEHL